jgi:hypothetical protein
MNAGKRLIAEVEADLEREFPGITERWRAITAPDAVPGGDDLDETVEAGRAWPVSQGGGE